MLSHPFFEGLDIDQLEKKAIKPPFMPSFGKKDLSEFFNVQQDKVALEDTYIPSANKRIVAQHNDEIEASFARRNIKKKEAKG